MFDALQDPQVGLLDEQGERPDMNETTTTESTWSTPELELLGSQTSIKGGPVTSNVEDGSSNPSGPI